MGRQRITEPDRNTAAGQFAHYLAHLCEAYDLNDVAEKAKISRATLFNYLNGSTSPTIDALDRLAKALGKKDYRAMMPSDQFLADLRRKR